MAAGLLRSLGISWLISSIKGSPFHLSIQQRQSRNPPFPICRDLATAYIPDKRYDDKMLKNWLGKKIWIFFPFFCQNFENRERERERLRDLSVEYPLGIDPDFEINQPPLTTEQGGGRDLWLWTLSKKKDDNVIYKSPKRMKRRTRRDKIRETWTSRIPHTHKTEKSLNS